jgi:hypothetical protein
MSAVFGDGICGESENVSSVVVMVTYLVCVFVCGLGVLAVCVVATRALSKAFLEAAGAICGKLYRRLVR